ncbi:MAG: ParA family protein [Actinomycetota bacterium]
MTNDFQDNPRNSLATSAISLAFCNQKGGVGKTTSAVNVGACLADAGARVLLVDLDPQGNASTGVGIARQDVKVGTYEVLAGTAVHEAIAQASVPNLDVLPSSIDLAGAEIELVGAPKRETKLRTAIDAARSDYDYILIDSPPSLGLLTLNALCAADAVIIPIQCEYYALEGLGQLLRTIDLVRDGLNPKLHVGGVVLTMYDARTKLSEQVVADVREHLGDVVFRMVIPRTVRLSEAPGYGKPVTSYDPGSRGAFTYRALSVEIMHRWPRGHAKAATPVLAQTPAEDMPDDERHTLEESR